MEVNKSNVKKLADDLSVLVINKVLAKEINIHEAMNSISLTQTFTIGRTMPIAKFEELLDRSDVLAVNLITCIKESLVIDDYTRAEIALALSTALSYVMDNTEEK